MKGDLHPAALRLSCSLPCRTHEQKVGEYAGRESVNNFRRVVIDGVRYDSMTEAARCLGCSRAKISNMMARGEGRFA